MGNNNSTGNNTKKTEENDNNKENSNCSEPSDAYYSVEDLNDSRVLHSVSTQESLKIYESQVTNKKSPCSILSTEEKYYSIDNEISMDLPNETSQITGQLKHQDVADTSNVSYNIEENMASQNSFSDSESSQTSLGVSKKIEEECAALSHKDLRNLNPIIRSDSVVDAVKTCDINESTFLDVEKNNKTESASGFSQVVQEDLEPQINLCISEKFEDKNIQQIYGKSRNLSPIIASQSKNVSLSPVIGSQSYRNNPLKNRTLSDVNSQFYCEFLTPIISIQNVDNVSQITEKPNGKTEVLSSNIGTNPNEASKSVEIRCQFDIENNNVMIIDDDENTESQSSVELVTEEYLKTVYALNNRPTNKEREVLSSSPVIGSQSYKNNPLRNTTISNQNSTQSYETCKSKQLSENVSISNRRNNTEHGKTDSQVFQTGTSFETARDFNLQCWLWKRPYTYECCFCGVKFRHFKNFKYHLFLHQEPKEKCPWCEKAYRLKCHLTKHIRSHHRGML